MASIPYLVYIYKLTLYRQERRLNLIGETTDKASLNVVM